MGQFFSETSYLDMRITFREHSHNVCKMIKWIFPREIFREFRNEKNISISWKEHWQNVPRRCFCQLGSCFIWTSIRESHAYAEERLSPPRLINVLLTPDSERWRSSSGVEREDNWLKKQPIHTASQLPLLQQIYLSPPRQKHCYPYIRSTHVHWVHVPG